MNEVGLISIHCMHTHAHTSMQKGHTPVHSSAASHGTDDERFKEFSTYNSSKVSSLFTAENEEK